MYSKNDFRYYRENRLMHSDDFLAHYGVKGMKWHKRTGEVKDFLKKTFITGPEEEWREDRIKKNQKKKDKADQKLKKRQDKINKKIDKLTNDKKSKKLEKESKQRSQKIKKYKNKDTTYDKAKRTGSKYAKGVKKEVRDAYEGQKEDIIRIYNSTRKPKNAIKGKR